ncbi:MAG: ABC transporter permease [Thermodesulfobacteriota bacterium]
MNPHRAHPASIQAMLACLWTSRDLIFQMTRREVIGRYRGSILGLAWSFSNPLLMLAVYTFVFSVVFKARWGMGEQETRTQFAVMLFAGLIVYNLLAEAANRAPGVILANANYVKKVVFPLEILPVVSVAAALFQCLVSLAVLLMAIFLFNGFLHWTVILFPLILLPLVAVSAGVSWGLASLGVYIRDVGQFIGIVTAVLLFVSPVFFPITALPEAYRPWMMANPLAFIIEQSRDVLVWGRLPDWPGLLVYSAAALVVAWLGFAWFQKTRKGFADVI